MKIRKFVTAAIVCGMLSGCATVFSGTTQNINLQAVNESNNETLEGAVCTIRDGNGMLYALHSNPGSVEIKRGQGSLTPDCKKKGYKQVSYGVGDSFNAVTIVNVLFWPGFLVDAVTGSMQKYPSHITVMMKHS